VSEDCDTETPQRDGYSVAVSESAFEQMKDDQHIRITDHSGMGPMSEFDVFVAFSVEVQR
jgi:hypothetical protein